MFQQIYCKNLKHSDTCTKKPLSYCYLPYQALFNWKIDKVPLQTIGQGPDPIHWSNRLRWLNQRVSGPVNAHLTPGPGIYFNAFIHVYSPRAGADNPLGTHVDVNRKPLSLCPFVASFKTISTRFFMFFHMYIAPGRGRQTPVVKILMSTERPYHFDHLLQVLKKILLNSFIHIF